MTKERQTVYSETLKNRVDRLSNGIQRVSAYTESLGTPTGHPRFYSEHVIAQASNEGRIEGGLKGLVQKIGIRRETAGTVKSLQQSLRQKTLPALERKREEASVQLQRFQEVVGATEAQFNEIEQLYQEGKESDLPVVYEQEYELARQMYEQKVDVFLGETKAPQVSVEAVTTQVSPVELKHVSIEQPVQIPVEPVQPAHVETPIIPVVAEKERELTFILPDGTVIENIGKVSKSILEQLPAVKDHAVPSSELARTVYREKLESGRVDFRVARQRTVSNVRNINEGVLRDTKWEIVNAVPQYTYEIVGGEKRRLEGRYYLTKKEEPGAQPPEADGEKNREVASPNVETAKPSDADRRYGSATPLRIREEDQAYVRLRDHPYGNFLRDLREERLIIFSYAEIREKIRVCQNEQLPLEERLQARKEIHGSCLRLIPFAIKQFMHYRIPREEVVGEAFETVDRCINAFDLDYKPSDPNRSPTFAGYVIESLRQDLRHLHTVNNPLQSVHVPFSYSWYLRTMSTAYESFCQRKGAEPTMQEWYEETVKLLDKGEGMDVSRATFYAMKIHVFDRPYVSIGTEVITEISSESLAPIRENIEDTILDDSLQTDPVAAAEMNALVDGVRTLLGTLPEREKLMLELRFGIGGNTPMTLAEVGEVLGVTVEAVRQSINGVFRRIRQSGKVKRLHDFIEE